MRTEAEQLLYYSIPGFFVFFFAFLFLIIIGYTSVFDIRGITFIVAAVIPVGFIVYQAYVLILYEKIWYGSFFKIQDPCKEFFQSYISKVLETLNEDLREELDKKKEISWLHMHTFRLHDQENQELVDYSWRLINLINARGVGAFTCIIALFIPIGYLIYQYAYSAFLKLPMPAIPGYETIVLVILYYASTIIFIAILIKGIPRIKKHLSDFNLDVLISKGQDLDQFVLGYVSAKVVCYVKYGLMERKYNEKAGKLIDDAFEHLRKREWRESLKKADDAYAISKPN